MIGDDLRMDGWAGREGGGRGSGDGCGCNIAEGGLEEGQREGEGEEGCEGRGARVSEGEVEIVGTEDVMVVRKRRFCTYRGVSSYAYGAVSKEASTGRYEGISQWQQQKALQTK